MVFVVVCPDFRLPVPDSDFLGPIGSRHYAVLRLLSPENVRIKQNDPGPV